MSSPTALLQSLGDLFQAPHMTQQDNAPLEKLIQLRHLEQLVVPIFSVEVVPLEIPPRLERFRLQTNDILIGIRAQPLRASLVPAELAGALPGQNLGILRPRKNIHPLYLCVILRSSLGQQLTQALFSQSTVKLINLKDLGSIKIPIPALELQQKIATIALQHEQETKLKQIELEQRSKVIEEVMLQLAKGEN